MENIPNKDFGRWETRMVPGWIALATAFCALAGCAAAEPRHITLHTMGSDQASVTQRADRAMNDAEDACNALDRLRDR